MLSVKFPAFQKFPLTYIMLNIKQLDTIHRIHYSSLFASNCAFHVVPMFIPHWICKSPNIQMCNCSFEKDFASNPLLVKTSHTVILQYRSIEKKDPL